MLTGATLPIVLVSNDHPGLALSLVVTRHSWYSTILTIQLVLDTVHLPQPDSISSSLHRSRVTARLDSQSVAVLLSAVKYPRLQKSSLIGCFCVSAYPA